MRRHAALALLLVCGCGGRPAPGPVPEGWTRRTIEHAFTIDVPSSIQYMAPHESMDGMPGDPADGGDFAGPGWMLQWSMYDAKHPFQSRELAEEARRHTVWSTGRTGAEQVNALFRRRSANSVFTAADSVQEWSVILAYRRRVLTAKLDQPLPADTSTAWRILRSIRILSDGE